MKKIVALVVALLLPMPFANADIFTLDNHNIGTIKNHVKFVPTVIDKTSTTFTFQIFIDNSMKDIDMLYLSLFNCNGGIVGYKRVYASKYGWDNFEDTYGGGKSTILKSFVFNNKLSYIPTQCIWESYRLQVSIWQVGMDNSTEISRATSGKYITNVIDVPINGQPFSGSLAIGVPDWKNPYTQTTPTPTQPNWIETHIQDINKIADGWNKATEALEANRKAEAEALKLSQLMQKLKRDLVNGTDCKKLNATKLAGGKTFVCKRINKKLVWR
jgi:hypothetical protein